MIDLTNLQTTHIPRWAADLLWPEVANVNQHCIAAVTHEVARERVTTPKHEQQRGLDWTDDAYANLIKRADKLRMAAWKSVHAKQPTPPLTAEEVHELARLDRATWWLQCKGARR